MIQEYKISTGWADYALMSEQQPLLALEAKKLGEKLEPHRTQMVTYANIAGIPYCGLTDGDQWEIYDVFRQKPLEDKCILRASIKDDSTAETALKFLLLWQPNIAAGVPAKATTPLLPRKPQALQATPGNGWTRLADFDLQADSPKAIRFPDGTDRELKTSRQILTGGAEWLHQNGHITPEIIPIRLGRKINLVGLTNGNQKRYFQIPGSNLHVYVNLSRDACRKATLKLIKECNQNPDQFLLC